MSNLIAEHSLFNRPAGDEGTAIVGIHGGDRVYDGACVRIHYVKAYGGPLPGVSRGTTLVAITKTASSCYDAIDAEEACITTCFNAADVVVHMIAIRIVLGRVRDVFFKPVERSIERSHCARL